MKKLFLLFGLAALVLWANPKTLASTCTGNCGTDTANGDVTNPHLRGKAASTVFFSVMLHSKPRRLSVCTTASDLTRVPAVLFPQECRISLPHLSAFR